MFLSIDIGTKNYAYSILDTKDYKDVIIHNKNIKISKVVKTGVYSLSGSNDFTRVLSLQTLLNDLIIEFKIDKVVIEKQLRINSKAVFLQHATFSFFAFNGINCDVIDSKLKTKFFTNDKLKYSERKKFTIDIVKTLSPESLIGIKKCDDIADSIVQCWVFNSHFL